MAGAMGCFSFFDSKKEQRLNQEEDKDDRKDSAPASFANNNFSKLSSGIRHEPSVPKDAPDVNIVAHTFTFRELATTTKNFRPECFIGEGGFGHVYKGHLENGQVAGNFLENPRGKYFKAGGIPDVAPDNDAFEHQVFELFVWIGKYVKVIDRWGASSNFLKLE